MLEEQIFFIQELYFSVIPLSIDFSPVMIDTVAAAFLLSITLKWWMIDTRICVYSMMYDISVVKHG